MLRPFRISTGEIWEKEFVVVEGRCGDYTGWGEAAVDGIPFYTAETAETALVTYSLAREETNDKQSGYRQKDCELY